MREKLVAILDEVNPELTKFTGEDFLEAGIIESMEIMDIVVRIEEEFQIEIDPRDISAEYFKSMDTLMKLIKKNME